MVGNSIFSRDGGAHAYRHSSTKAQGERSKAIGRQLSIEDANFKPLLRSLEEHPKPTT